VQGPEIRGADFREVGKQFVPAVVRRDESKTFMSRCSLVAQVATRPGISDVQT
jgi:hypothetical protein